MRLLLAPKMTDDEKVIIVVKFATGFVCLSLFLNILSNNFIKYYYALKHDFFPPIRYIAR